MFESSAKMGQGKEFVIKECSQKTFEETLEFLYTGNVKEISSLTELFFYAHQLQIQNLRNLCEDKILLTVSKKPLDMDGFVALMQLAAEGAHDLLLPCLHFANSCKDEVDLTSCSSDLFPKMLALAIKNSLDIIAERLEKEIMAKMR